MSATFPLANTPRASWLVTVSCASPGNCTAGGSFGDGNSELGLAAFSLTSTNDVWAEAVPATFSLILQASTPSSTFRWMSCATPGNCTGVGNYLNEFGYDQAFTQTSTDGVWADSVPPVFPASANQIGKYEYLTGVSCLSPGNCTAVGAYTEVGNNQIAFTQTSVGGVWTEAVPLTLDPNLRSNSPYEGLTSVSCVPPGTCVAAGFFANKNAYREAVTQSLTRDDGAPVVAEINYTGDTNAPSSDTMAMQSGGPATAASPTDIAVSAVLTSDSKGLANRSVTFTLNGNAVKARTDRNGFAAATIPNPGFESTQPVVAYFDGDRTYRFASDQSGVVIAPKARTSLAYAGTTSATRRTSITLAAVMTANDSPIEGQTVTFTFSHRTFRATTDVNGMAVVPARAPGRAGTYPILITYDANLTLGASTTSASLNVS